MTSARTLVIGSRGSALALWQARHVAALLERTEGAPIESRINIIKTTGDHLQTASLTQAGGTGLFTKELEHALLEHKIDVAVHSLKDLPTEMTPGLAIAAIPQREEPRDALVGSKLASLKPGARVGTSSGRRAAQLRHLRRDLVIEPVRGNVDTRLRKLKAGQFDAIVLAAAGLKRLGLEDEIAEILPHDQVCPAPGQGALGIQTRANDPVAEICFVLDHPATRLAVEAERAFLAGLGGGCQLPVGAFAEKTENLWSFSAVVASPDGSRLLREEATHPDSPSALVDDLIEKFLEGGAAGILAQSNV